MNRIDSYPLGCRHGIRKLSELLCTDYQTVYAMMLLTASLMDLYPGDQRVIDMILKDCKVEVQA